MKNDIYLGMNGVIDKENCNKNLTKVSYVNFEFGIIFIIINVILNI